MIMPNIHYSERADSPKIGYIWTDERGQTHEQLNCNATSDITFSGAQEARDFSVLVAELAVEMDRQAERVRKESEAKETA